MGRDQGFLINAGPSMLVMAMLRERARHGYDISKELESLSDNRLSFQYGTLYPLLHKLEKKGLIKSVWDQPEGERARRVYMLTEQGKAEIDTQIEKWSEYTDAVKQVIEATSGETV